MRTKIYAPVRIVAFGGGTGLSKLLRGLKEHVARLSGSSRPFPLAPGPGPLRTAARASPCLAPPGPHILAKLA